MTTLQSESPRGPPGSVEVVDFTLLGQRFQALMADADGARSKRVTEVMLKMVKLDIAELKKAYGG